MIRLSGLALCAAISAAWPGTALSNSGSIDVVGEAAPPAIRIVRTTGADFASAASLASLKRRIRSAASAACNDQYRGEISPVLRGCGKAAAADGLGQLDRLIARTNSATRLADSAIVVRAK